MTACQQARPAPYRCPTPNECLAAIFALLPRGRAWQSNEGGPIVGYARGFDEGNFDEPAFQTQSRAGSVLAEFWRAIAEVVAFVNQRFCDLRLEFWCATHSETHDLWMREYGLPDDCDPFPDLCTKVAAIGGTRCEYYAAIAARAGWSIDCETLQSADCGDQAGLAVAGCAQVGGTRGGAVFQITVHLRQSPAYTAPSEVAPFAGVMQAGNSLACAPDIGALVCVIERIVHAHLAIIYQIIED